MREFFRNNIELFYVLLTVFLLVARDILSIHVPDTLLVGMWGIAMLSMHYEQIVPFAFFMFPLSCGVPGYSYLLIYIFLLIKGPSLNKSQIFPIAAVSLLEYFNELGTADTSTLVSGISFLAFTAIFFYFIGLDGLQFDLKKSMMCYVIGTILCCIIIYYNMFSFYGVEGVLSGYFRSGALGIEGNDKNEMAGHIAMNANTIAYFAISAISILWVSIRSYSNRKLLVFVIIFLVVSGLLSFSRTFILTMFLLIVAIILTNNIKKNSSFLAIGTLVGIVTISAFQEYILYLFDTFSERGREASIATAGGRTVLFSFYNQAWTSDLGYMIYGVGTISHVRVLHGYNAIHNGLQQLWVSLGVIGTIVFFLRIIGYLKEHYTSSSKVFFIPFLVTFVFDQSIQFLNPYPLELPIMVTLLMLQFDKQTE